MPLPPSVVRALAALRDSDSRTPRADRDRAVYVVDTYADRVRLVIPGPRRLARSLVVPYLRESGAELFVDLGGDLVGRRHGTTGEPVPLPLDRVASALTDDVAALALLGSSGGAAYRSLSRLALLDSAQCREIMLAALQAARHIVPPVREPVTRADRPAPLTPAERKAAKRKRDQLDEAASVAAYLATVNVSPGDRLDAVSLFDAADEWLDAAQGDYEDAVRLARNYEEDLLDYRDVLRNRHRTSPDGKPRLAPEPPQLPEPWASIAAAEGFPDRPRTMSRQRFNQLVAEHFGERRVCRGVRLYVVPTRPNAEEAPEMSLDSIREETAAYTEAASAGERLLTIRDKLAAGDRVGALHDQREGFAATGAEGGPVADLANVRARRAAR